MADETIVVRDAGRADVETLAAFNLAMAAETEAKALDLERLRAGVRGVFDVPGRGFYLVAEIGGQAAGCLMITYEWSDWRNADWWWIQSVYVAPAFRRRGVYRALHAHVERRARQAGIRGLRLYVERENHAAQNTYRTMGMSRAVYDMFEVEFGPA